MTELVDTERLLPIPGTGEAVDLDSPEQVGQALANIREYESELREAKSLLSIAVHEVMDRQAEWTIRLPGLELRGQSPDRSTFDVDQLRHTLADCVEHGLISQDAADNAVKTKVTYEPAKRGIAKLLKLGGEVADRVRACERPDDSARRVSVKRVGQ